MERRGGEWPGRYEAFTEHSEFYPKVAKPLLSMRTIRSIDVEQRIKPIKKEILTKKRNSLQDPKGVALLQILYHLPECH